ncbi:hypothetical protein [Nocardiopsis sp. CNT-189]|uniref:hypothetical protein n=1 Tax=Nocardiopsis oceanisediminis TaxID=2816862 RepID=UPI003B3B695F
MTAPGPRNVPAPLSRPAQHRTVRDPRPGMVRVDADPDGAALVLAPGVEVLLTGPHAGAYLTRLAAVLATARALLSRPSPTPGGARVLHPRVHRPDEVTDHADGLYDALSEALCERGRTVADRARNQQAADDAFTALDEHLRRAGVLPTPWKNAGPPPALL